jgi:anhydro-N-acetylmuramic acid kinase
MNEVYIGLMSGTSLDGIDAVAVDFAKDSINPIAWHYAPFEHDLKQALTLLLKPQWRGGLQEVGQIDAQLGEAYAESVLELISASGLQRNSILAIGSHGQTVFHSPDTKPAFSMQLGDPNRIAHKTGITVISDFRRRDIAAGGQGAPLVPAFHKDIFYSPTENRVILNIGGIANITRLSIDSPVTGFDTGPGNVLMDAWINQHKDVDYDKEGAWAASGKVIDELLRKMLEEPYFHLPPPKSTGRELFNLEWLDQYPQVPKARPEDIQATLAELTVQSISKAIRQHVPETEAIYVCGGGAYNSYLMKRLKEELEGIRVADIAMLGLEADRVEAVAFAWLARRTMLNLHGNLPEVTGAESELVLGGLYKA